MELQVVRARLPDDKVGAQVRQGTNASRFENVEYSSAGSVLHVAAAIGQMSVASLQFADLNDQTIRGWGWSMDRGAGVDERVRISQDQGKRPHNIVVRRHGGLSAMGSSKAGRDGLDLVDEGIPKVSEEVQEAYSLLIRESCEDRDRHQPDLDAQTIIDEAQAGPGSQPQVPSTMTPQQMLLSLLRIPSFCTMQDRVYVVGENGGQHHLRLLQNAPASVVVDRYLSSKSIVWSGTDLYRLMLSTCSCQIGVAFIVQTPWSHILVRPSVWTWCRDRGKLRDTKSELLPTIALRSGRPEY
ncbi:hypothetical protein DB88DRAFT_520204 [Papiliotrema laurentii]|uniref:Uncharacterized protein n=1 Tax=Papiliotrema laurentii TaxID=5418 RepID=A0AAD9CUD6_PAPLA|nr:hypothetical protein DB88DRAFT_520204 [Papiliotrema laurentii]